MGEVIDMYEQNNSEVTNFRFPNSLEPLDDEIFYSFLLRTAKINAMQDVVNPVQ